MQKNLTLLVVFVFMCFTPVFAQNQNGTIKGFVYDQKTGEPMIYTTVAIVNVGKGVQTDVNGYFSISLPSGAYKLLTTALGFDSSVLEINLLPNSIVTKKILLGQREHELQGVEVSGRKTEKITHVNVGITSISERDIQTLPSAGGEPDVAQYLQVVPGVIFTGDQGGQLYIRGGSPAQTGIYLDGVTIYNPFHSIGLYSVFETDAIRNVDVYTAGFGAQYGDRTSAIVDVHTKDGNKNDISGIVSVSPIMSRALLEGPIVKSKKNNGSGVTFLVSAKTSYLDQTSKSLYSGLGEPFSSGLPYKFTDVYGKVTFNGDNGSKLNLFGFNFDDHATLLDDSTHQSIGDYHWQARGAGATFIVSPSNSSALIDGKFAYSNYNIALGQVSIPGDTLPQSSQINGFEAAINFTYFLPNYSQLKYGFEVDGIHTSLNYYLAPGIPTADQGQSTIAGLYFSYRQDFSNKVIFEPSIRFEYYSELQKLSPEPRLGLKINLSDNVRLKFATGIYSQNIVSTKTDQDIVNLFSGFILSPEQQITNAHGQTVNSNLQTAYHGVGGIEVDINKVELNFEPWVKYFGQIDEFNRNVTSPESPAFVAASGLAEGVDFSAKYTYQRIYFWLAAGYQNVNYTSIDSKGNEQTYPAPFDARFNANIVSSYTAGKKKDWEFSARFNVRSPFPFTQTQGFRESLNLASGGLSTNPLTQNGNIGIIYADAINGGRLSWYHRLDLSARKKFVMTKKVNLDLTFSLTNVYDRNNVFYVDRVTNVVVYQLPIFPSVNLTLNF